MVVSSFLVFFPDIRVVWLCQRESFQLADLTENVCFVRPRSSQVQFEGRSRAGGDWGQWGLPPALVLGALVVLRCNNVYVCMRCLDSGVHGDGAAQPGDVGPALLWLMTAFGRELNLLKMSV